MSRICLFLAALLTVSCCCGKQVAPPEPAPGRLAVDVTATPEKAVVAFMGKSVGETPTSLVVSTFADLPRIEARRGTEEAIERRIRILSPEKAQVTFRFGTEPSAVARRLGLTRVLVFDYSETVSFDSGKADLKPEALPILEKQAEVLATAFPGVPVHVCGNTDSTGSDPLNLALSLQRAETVAKVLESKGLPRARMKVQGFGKEYPLETNATPEGRATNRRTELVLPQ
jgi:outer membrane protein OmpA-like peptidoglycan-associated protein